MATEDTSRLVLTLLEGEDVVIGDNIRVEFLAQAGSLGKIRLAVRAPRDVKVLRGELMHPRYRIYYIDSKKPARVVGPEFFERISGFAPVLKLAVGESVTRYRSAGYKRIERIS